MRPLGLIATIVGMVGSFWTWRLLQWFISADTITSCIIGEVCPVVFSTSFSRFLGLPIHLFALIWFFALTLLAIMSALGRHGVTKIGLILGALSVPTVIYLDYVQLAIIHAICWDCVTAHLLGLALFGSFAVMFVQDKRSGTEQ